MGVLGNIKHEAFAQEVHRQQLSGEKRGAARTAAYRTTIYTGESPVDDAALAPDARKMANRNDVKARIQELADFASKLAGIDKNWALVKLKGFAEANLDDYLGPPDAEGYRYFDLRGVPRDKIALLGELTQDQVTEYFSDEDDPSRRLIRKIKLKLHDPLAALRLMVEISGWKAAEKHDLSFTDHGDKLDAARKRLAGVSARRTESS
jgi:hypothetical protein